MRITRRWLLPLLALIAAQASAEQDAYDPPPREPDPLCTARNPATQEFYDLSGLGRTDEDGKDWHAVGHDYGRNFTLNVCLPLVSMHTFDYNVSAAIGGGAEDALPPISIGATTDRPFYRGRRLLLQYDGGDACPGGGNLRRSTLIAFVCDHEMYRQAHISFVGALNDCAYFFEFRTSRACATQLGHQTAMGPVSVFGIIVLIAFTVYLLGGCVYQRKMMNATGWRQIPNYEVWFALYAFTRDLLRLVLLPVTRVFRVSGRRPRASTLRQQYSYEQDNGVIDDIDTMDRLS